MSTTATAIPQQATDLSVIVVTHDSGGFIDDCLDAVCASDYTGEVETIVVDNRSTDDTLARVRTRHPEVRLIVAETRGGFSRNVNIGIGAAAGRRILVLNPDTRVDAGALRIAMQHLDAHPAVGMVGCHLEDERGLQETSCRGFPTLWRAFCELLLLDRLFPRWRLFADRTLLDDAERERLVDWITGAFILVRREVIEGTGERRAAGLLDEGFFLFVEDTEWCRRASDAGWQIAYVPAARAVHHKGSGHGWDLWRYALTCQGIARYFEKHHGPSRAAVYQLMLVGGLLLRAVIAALAPPGHGVPPGERGYRVRGYLALAARTMTGRLFRADGDLAGRPVTRRFDNPAIVSETPQESHA